MTKSSETARTVLIAWNPVVKSMSCARIRAGCSRLTEQRHLNGAASTWVDLSSSAGLKSHVRGPKPYPGGIEIPSPALALT